MKVKSLSTDGIVSSKGIIGMAGGSTIETEQIFDVASFAEEFIAVDGGADYLLDVGVSPSLVIGDLDSLSRQAFATFENILCHISEQDTTDFEKALTRVKARGIVALGFTGGRIDHQLAVLNVMMRYQSCPVVLLDRFDVSFLAPEYELELRLSPGTRIAAMALEEATVSFLGVKWPFKDQVMRPSAFMSSSNEVKDQLVKIRATGPVLISLPPSCLDAVVQAVFPAG